ncbi:hypothetical protein BHYA_0688g00020 [Botrytis hyacinthi]|uniref:Uncharacterized protein n=1 Tax=Botrytis hyacinthi TaxID=278943 RepID=A0A4Z1G3D5_9HELO|nr:hypothetical protein BHYA_0688g00020 [Botrytis hyacinthi]
MSRTPPPPEIPTCTLHYTCTLHQNLSKPDISTPWTIYLQTPTHWYTINFHEQKILDSRLSSPSLSPSVAKFSQRELYDFELRELDSPPEIWERCPDSDDGEARVTKRVKEFGVVRESIGMRRLLREFGERVRRQEIPVDEVIWNETLTLLKLTNHSGPNKSGLYLIPHPHPSSSSPQNRNQNQNPILFSWTHGSLTTKNNILHARGKYLTFSPPPYHSSTPPPPTVHLHPLPKNSLTPSPHFAASINRSHFSKRWEEYEVDINQPAIPCVWWEKNITILEDGVLLREYEDLYERSKEKGGTKTTPSTSPSSTSAADKTSSATNKISRVRNVHYPPLPLPLPHLTPQDRNPSPPEPEPEPEPPEKKTEAMKSTEIPIPPSPREEPTPKIWDSDPDPNPNPDPNPPPPPPPPPNLPTN